MTKLPEQSKVAWTEFRLRFILSMAVLVAAGVLVGIEDGIPRITLLVLVVAVTVAALHLDAFAGIVVGVVAAGGLVLAKRLSGTWGPQELFVVAAEVTTLVELAWIVGLLGDHLRGVLRRLSRPAPGSLVPAYGSLGLLDVTPASFRLDEELTRRSRTGQPLGVMLMSADVASGDVDEEATMGARRAVARHVESLLRDTDVPFALSPRVLGAILPATDRAEAWAMLGTLVESAGNATFADRVHGTRYVVSDVIDLNACVVFADDDTSGADDLLEAAVLELDRDTDDRARA